MKTIFLVRHAQAEGQSFTSPLTERGRKQAEALASFLKDKEVDCIYSSPFKRAIDTILPLAKSTDVKIIKDERLGERILSASNMEDWKGKLKQSFEDFDLIFEGGESQRTGMERAVSILEDVLQSSFHSIVLVSHGNLTALLLRYFNKSFGFEELMEMTNPDVFEITVANEKAVLNRIWDDRI